MSIATITYILGIAQGLLIGWTLWRRPRLVYPADERTQEPTP